MAMMSIERRREIRKLEARRDDLLTKTKKMRMDLASTRAALKSAKQRRG